MLLYKYPISGSHMYSNITEVREGRRSEIWHQTVKVIMNKLTVQD